MPHELSWIIPKRVILVEITNPANDQEIPEFDQRVCQMLDEGDPEAALIHQILVFGDGVSTPSMKALSSMSSPRHPRNGWVIMVGVGSPMVPMVTSIVSQIFKIRTRTLDTPEEALVFLREVDSTLPRDATTDAAA